MNLALRRAVQSSFATQQCRSRLTASITPEGLKFGNKSGFVVPSRGISNHEKDRRLVLRAWKLKEQFKHPERYAKPRPRYNFSDWNYTADIFDY